MRGSSGANCGVSTGGAAVDARFDGGLELAGVQVDGGGVLGSGDGETAKERGDQLAGVFVVLMHAKDQELRLYLGRATAAVRWRPAGRSGAAWQSDGSTARGVEERRELWRDAWEGHVKLEVAGWPRAAVAAPLRRRSEREQGGRLEVEGSGLVCNFRNSRDLTVNQQ